MTNVSEPVAMRLYKAVSASYARHVIDVGFIGVPNCTVEGEYFEYVEMRDIPPAGLTFSRTAEMEVAVDEVTGHIDARIGGGPVLADDLGDFIVSIAMPADVAAQYRITYEDPPGWPFQEYWLDPDVTNAYRHTFVVFDSDDGEEVRPDLMGK